MRIKLIGDEQVGYLAVRNALETLQNDPNFSTNRDLYIDDEWYDTFITGIRNIYKKYKEKDDSESVPEIDYDLFDLFSTMDLEPNKAAATEFWGSLTIQSDIALKLVRKRWATNYNWFRDTITGVDKIFYKYRRYAGKYPYSQTYYRIWWMAKMVPSDKKDVLFKQQDFADKSIQNKYVLWGQSSNGKYISRTMELLLNTVEDFDKLKESDPSLSSIPRQNVVRQVFEWLTILKDVSMLDLMDNEDLKETIEEMFDKAIELEIQTTS